MRFLGSGGRVLRASERALRAMLGPLPVSESVQAATQHRPGVSGAQAASPAGVEAVPQCALYGVRGAWVSRAVLGV